VASRPPEPERQEEDVGRRERKADLK
jgi:hypothetical protein